MYDGTFLCLYTRSGLPLSSPVSCRTQTQERQCGHLQTAGRSASLQHALHTQIHRDREIQTDIIYFPWTIVSDSACVDTCVFVCVFLLLLFFLNVTLTFSVCFSLLLSSKTWRRCLTLKVDSALFLCVCCTECHHHHKNHTKQNINTNVADVVLNLPLLPLKA